MTSSCADWSDCLICPGEGVEPHHHPRRSAGEGFAKLHIEVDDPRRIVPLCRRMHDALHKKDLVLERFRSGLLFTLDSVSAAPEKPDADYLLDGEGQVVWQWLVPPVDLDESVGNAAFSCEEAVRLWEPLIPYMKREQVDFAYQALQELSSQHIWRVRALLEEQRLRVTFGWHSDPSERLCRHCDRKSPYGKPWGEKDKIASVAGAFGVSPRTVERDLRTVPVLKDGYEGPKGSAREDGSQPLEFPASGAPPPTSDSGKRELECPTSPDGRHVWQRKCGLCGAER